MALLQQVFCKRTATDLILCPKCKRAWRQKQTVSHKYNL